ncbi:MAG: hypothetical protein ABS52_17920 [Gemmatimonadetes bacterium SCN 70-22]|nr:MAG: hypothetical protein ABS52_17920 [Gemmatimonadetes bacterium SCN 70-22]
MIVPPFGGTSCSPFFQPMGFVLSRPAFLLPVLVATLAGAPSMTLAGAQLPASVSAGHEGRAGDARAAKGKDEGGALTTARAVRARVAPVIDGHDDDPAWQVAPPIDDFKQFTPVEDGDPSFRTEVRVVYDDRNLFVVIRAFDPHPDSIVSLLSRRDVRTNSDQLKVIIDGYMDRRTGIQLMLNPAGVKRDASIYSDYVEDMSWDGVWDGAAAIDSLGWVAEFRIPFSQLRFNGGAPTFGFGVWRDIARRNERAAWPAFRQSRQALASQLGTLEGIRGIQRGSRLELLPYAVTKNVTEPGEEGWRHPQKLTAGVDLKYGVTPNLTLDATVNPDFGQVEVDPALLNLTAFEVRFEERRPFFQEGVGLFKCGGPCEGVFYTRRIGRTPQLRSSSLDPSGTTILGAAKLTGRLRNGVAVGLVEAVTRREEGVSGETVEPETNYFVGRLVKEMREGRTQLGTMVTAVNRNLDDHAAGSLRRDAYNLLLQGVHRFGRDRWELMAYTGLNRVSGSERAIALTQLNSVHFYQRPDHEERFDSTRTSLGGNVVAASISKVGGAVRWNTYLRRATPGLELNDLGFVPTVNDVSVRNEASWQALRPGAFYRRSFNLVSTENHWTTGGLPSGTRVTAHSSFELLNSWGVALTYNINNLGTAHCVSCARGGPAVRQGPAQELGFSVTGDPRNVLVPRVSVLGGVGDGGRSHTGAITAGGELRVASRFSAAAELSYQARDDDQQWIGNYGALLSDTTHYTFAHLDQSTVGITARLNWTASPTLSFQLYAQPFVSTGTFRNWREVADPRAGRYEDRYRPYGGQANPDGFSYKQFNSNAVVRWEYRPGSTLFLVWQQGRLQSDANRGAFDFSRDYRDLFRAHPDNTLLVKVAYWVNP